MFTLEYLDFLQKTFIAFFVIIDPFAIIPVFINATMGDTRSYRQKMALKATIIATVVLLIFAITGDSFLTFIGISQGSFKIAGGILLFFAGLDMVIARNSGIRTTTDQETEEAAHKTDISVFPLAIPLIAGPGALTTLIISMREVEGNFTYEASVIGVLLIVLAMTYICLVASQVIFRVLGVTGTNVLTRIFGIVIAALAVEYVIKGIQDSFF